MDKYLVLVENRKKESELECLLKLDNIDYKIIKTEYGRRYIVNLEYKDKERLNGRFNWISCINIGT